VGTQNSTTMCHVETPFLTQAKGIATYAIPRVGVNVAATVQSVAGPLIAANYIATSAVIAPSLGRPLAGGTANATLNLITPGTLYGERLNELDLRLTKVFKFGRGRVGVNFDAYNLFNGNYVTGVQSAYAAWLTPTAILAPRLFKISAQFDF